MFMFWSRYDDGDAHPDDAPFLNLTNSLRWSLRQAQARGLIFEADQSLHGMLHLNCRDQNST